MKTKRNFTLVELLIVIAIIAILASMILPALRSALDKARAISCISNHKQLSTATHMYTDDNKGYMPYHPSSAPAMSFGSTTGRPKWNTLLWSYVTHEPITSEHACLKQVTGGREPKLSMFRCPAVQEPFNISEEMKHIGRNMFLSNGSYEPNLFISKCRWPSDRMVYSDYYGPAYSVDVAHYTSGSSYTVGYTTYLHPGLTASITHLDGHVKAWSMNAIPQSSWNSRFWGANPSCTGKLK